MGATVTPAVMLEAYAMGIFPMAASAVDTELQWFEPAVRGGRRVEAEVQVPVTSRIER